MELGTTWSGCSCPWQGGWNYVVLKVPCNPNHSMIHLILKEMGSWFGQTKHRVNSLILLTAPPLPMGGTQSAASDEETSAEDAWNLGSTWEPHPERSQDFLKGLRTSWKVSGLTQVEVASAQEVMCDLKERRTDWGYLGAGEQSVWIQGRTLGTLRNSCPGEAGVMETESSPSMGLYQIFYISTNCKDSSGTPKNENRASSLWRLSNLRPSIRWEPIPCITLNEWHLRNKQNNQKKRKP